MLLDNPKILEIYVKKTKDPYVFFLSRIFLFLEFSVQAAGAADLNCNNSGIISLSSKSRKNFKTDFHTHYVLVMFTHSSTSVIKSVVCSWG